MTKVDFSDPATIKVLTAALEAAGLEGLEITRPGQSLRIVINGDASGRRLSVSNADQRTVVVKSPMAGEFLHDLPAAPHTQRRERPADTLGFLRVGPVLLPLKTESPARVDRYLADHGTIVGFGDPIAEIASE